MTQDNCDCLPLPSPSGCNEADALDCKILYYLGEKTEYTGNNKKFGDLLYLYAADKEDWEIEDYHIDDLLIAEILPISGASAFTTFTLTEKELLAAHTFESWKLFCGSWQSAGDGPKPFGVLCAEALNANIDHWNKQILKVAESIKNYDVSKLGEVQNSVAIVSKNISEEENRVLFKKLEACWVWLKNIHDSYYGRKFLVKIGEKSPYLGDAPHPFRGICVKDENGEFPKLGTGGAYFIKGDGAGQGYTVSDMISTDGGFFSDIGLIPDLIGLAPGDLDFVRLEDGKIDAFMKIGFITNSDGELYEYEKFTDELGNPVKWFLDFTKLDPNNYIIKSVDGVGDILYIRAQADEKIYFSDDIGSIPAGQWALLTLTEPVPLELINNNGYNAYNIIKLWLILHGIVKETLPFLQKYLNIHEGLGTDPLPDPLPWGTRHNLSQLNLNQLNNISYLPSGAVVPMKSNIYTYGPYYYDGKSDDEPNSDGDSGGVEVVKHEVLAPWNFYNPNIQPNDVAGAYERMDCVGVHLAKDSSKGLQQLEKGKITLPGLPVLKLGESVDDLSIFPDKDGPTILTDISVDYGSSGFRTTYNFETYTPKFGDTAKHILDSWSDNIKDNQNLNEALREERSKALSRSKELQQSISTENKYRTGRISPIYNHKSTPNKLLISGFYLEPDPSAIYELENNEDLPSLSPEPSPSESEKPFDLCKVPPPLPFPEYPVKNKNRIYSFAETHEAYQALYVQNTYRQLSIMSIDGLYLPISLIGDPEVSDDPASNTGRVSRFSMRTEHDKSYVEWKDSIDLTEHLYSAGYPNPSKSRDEIPPFKLIGSSAPKCYSLPIHQQYLNPMLSTKLMEDWDDRKNASEKGFVISSIAFGEDFKEYQITHNDTEGEDGDDETDRQKQKNFRFSALRGPLTLQGWGYDTAGKPIPNEADSPYKAERGQFTRTQLTDKFMKNWIENPKTWPAGPIDLRFDRERGVWTCASPNKIVVARLREKLKPNGKAKAQLINPKAGGIRFYETYNISGPNGENVKLSMNNTSILVYDFLGVELCAGDIIYAYYDDNRYIVVESSRAYKAPDQDTEYCDFLCTTTTTTSTTTTTPTTTTTTTPTTTIATTTIPTITIPTPTPSPDCWCGLECLQTLENYNPGMAQILGQEDGCLKWFDMTSCEPSPSRT